VDLLNLGSKPVDVVDTVDAVDGTGLHRSTVGITIVSVGFGII
jgi:hypothetical protein